MAAATADTEFVKRDARALTQHLTVLDRLGRVRDADGLFLVVSQSGKEYLVDARNARCECDDHKYRQTKCKHMRRVEFATGRREIPAWVDPDEVDESLGEHCAGEPRWAE